MKYKEGMNLRRLLEVYNLPINPEVPDEILDEPLEPWGEDFLNDIKQGLKEIDEKIFNYLSSEKFIEDAKEAFSTLFTEKRLECNDYWLEICYTRDNTIEILVDMEMKIP